MRFHRRLALAVLVLAACGQADQTPLFFDGGLDDGDGGLPQPGDGSVINPMPDLFQGIPSCSNIVGDRHTQVCLRWTCDRQDRSEGTWSGSVASCNAGDTSPDGRANALKLINMYRFLANAGLPSVTNDTTKDARAQECALMMDANNALSHTPPMSWTCYSSVGAMTALRSNIASTPGVEAIDLYMNDFGSGSATTIGHRRWLMSNSLGPVGLGSTTDASCAEVINGSGSAGAPWVAWPPPGPLPFEAFSTGGFGNTLDNTGWTVQSDSISFAGATVTVTRDNLTALPVDVTQLLPNYGSSYAIRFTTNGWNTQAGHTYHVSVGNIATPISYDVEVVTCP